MSRTIRMLDAVRDVTLEEFRAADAHFERHSRLGRELLYLVANNSWCRRTTEIIDVNQARAVNTDVIVDLDLSFADHEAFQSDDGPVWIPVLVLPPMLPTLDTETRSHRRRWFAEDGNNPIAGLDVSDTTGTRVPQVRQNEVQQWLAAALSEIVLKVIVDQIDSAAADTQSWWDRDPKLLLAAAIRRLLANAGSRPPDGGAVSTDLLQARALLEKVFNHDLVTMETDPAQVIAVDDDLDGRSGRPRPVLGSHIGDILEALIGTTLVVIAVEDPGCPISYTVHIPPRRLSTVNRAWAWFEPRALLSIDLLAPTAQADRQIRLVLPDGVTCHDGSQGVLGRIDVVLPAPFERLDALMQRLFPASLPSDRPASWVDARIAEMALHKVDAALDSLRHYEVVETRASMSGAERRPGRRWWPHRPLEHHVELLTATVNQRLRGLREELAAVRRTGSGVRTSRLHDSWSDGDWFPFRMRRRLVVNTASPQIVMIETPAIEDTTLRARPTVARIDTDVSVFDSPVFNVARYTSVMNTVVLAALTAVLHWGTSVNDNRLQLIVTVLVLFSAVQAGQIDASTLRDMLSRASYWVMIAAVLPTVLLALALAALPSESSDEAAAVALAFQFLVFIRLRRGPLSRWRRRPPVMVLATGSAPDHARVDVLRDEHSRDLLTEALTFGREAFAYMVVRPTGRDQFTGLLERSQGDERVSRITDRAARLSPRGRRWPGGGDGIAPGLDLPERQARPNLLGVIQSATPGLAMTYMIFRDQPREAWLLSDLDQEAAGQIEAVPLDPDRLTPSERPEWVLEIFIGIPDGALAIQVTRHPLLDIAIAAQRYNFQIITAQMPAPPPADGTGRRWTHLQVGVTYRHGDSLRGLGSFLYRLRRMDGSSFGDGTLAVLVRVNAQDPTPSPDAGSRPLSDRDFDVVPDEEAANKSRRHWRTLGLTAHTRVGLLRDVLVGLAKDVPTYELAGLTLAALHGQVVILMVGRDEVTAMGAETTLRWSLPKRVRPDDRLVVTMDQRLTARTLDGAPGDSGHLMLRVGLRTPDRPGLLQDTLTDLRRTLAEHGPDGVTISGLDVWFAHVEVVNGRTTQGRLTVRLPGRPSQWAHWQRVNWTAVKRSMNRSAALTRARKSGDTVSSSDLDDTVITVQLLSRQFPRPLTPPPSRPGDPVRR